MTNPKIGSELERANGDLMALRAKYGAESDIGHCCSNLFEMLAELPPGPDERIEYLTSDSVLAQRENILKNIEREKARLAKLLAAR